MTPHTQTFLHRPDWKPGDIDPPGDCFRTCVASLLDLSLEEVPHFVEIHHRTGMDWRALLLDFLEPRGLSVVEIDVPTLCGTVGYGTAHLWISNGGHCIVSGISPRSVDGTGWHSCIGSDFKVVHDPHPSRDGLVGTCDDWQFMFFIKKL